LGDALGLSEEDRAYLEAAWQRRKRGKAAAATTPRPSTSPLVGRIHELGLLERHLAGEGPPVLVLAGEPGIGKSRLLREAAALGEAHGRRVLAGGCARRDGEMPYAPLLDALKLYVDEQKPAALHKELAGCAGLVRLLPELAALPAIGETLTRGLPSWPLTPAQERRLMFEAVARFLSNVAGPAGTLLVLDDLQWAGTDALDLLLSLLRSPSPAPEPGDSPSPASGRGALDRRPQPRGQVAMGRGVRGILRVVGAYRDNEAPPGDPLAILLADLAAAGLVTHHALTPLSAQETGQLFDALSGDAAGIEEVVRERALQRSEGVPFYVVSFAQTLRQGERGGTGASGGTSGEGDTAPWDVAQGLRQRVAALSNEAQAMLGAAAVVGRRAPVTLLVAATGRPEDEALDALEQATRARLLEAEGHGAYRFAHDLVREAVESGLGPARRALLHRRVAAALETGAGAGMVAGEPPVEELAYHYSRAGDGCDEKAATYLERAGDRALVGYATEAAEGYYRAAVARLDRWPARAARPTPRGRARSWAKRCACAGASTRRWRRSTGRWWRIAPQGTGWPWRG